MTTKNAAKRPALLLLLPVCGIVFFSCLYVWAACLYPGGSREYPQAKSFSLLYNYWCDLFDVVTPNGSINPARPVAIFAMFVLTASFGLLWILLPRLFDHTNRYKAAIQYTGSTSMLIAAFLFTSYHEAVINCSGLLGGVALTLTFTALYKAGYTRLFIIGCLCLAFSCFNYFIYETGILLYLLAVTQKITFLLFFIWAGWINMTLYRKTAVSTIA